MKTKPTSIGIALGLSSLLSSVPTAHAVEGAMGRPISGAGIMPYAGLVPRSQGS